MTTQEKQIIYTTQSQHIRLGAGEACIIFDMYAGRQSEERSIVVELVGAGAQCEITSIVLGSEAKQHTIHHRVEHHAPHTQSVLELKGLLAGESHCSVHAQIIISEHAKHSSAMQRADMLLLSQKAKVAVQPDLEIKQKDVSCGHGVSITRIAPEKLFYFESRGVSTGESRRALAEAHIADIASRLSREQQRRLSSHLATLI